MDGCELFLIRHAATSWNDAGRLQGQTDVPLHADGRRQAEDLAEQLRARGLDVVAVYSSDLQRALQTAQIIAEQLRVPLFLDARLRERRLGLAEGLTWSEVEARFGARGGWERRMTLDAVPGVESRDALIRRVDEALRDIARAHPGGRVAVVGHGSAFSNWLGWRFQLEERPRFPNAGVIQVGGLDSRNRQVGWWRWW